MDNVYAVILFLGGGNFKSCETDWPVCLAFKSHNAQSMAFLAAPAGINDCRPSIVIPDSIAGLTVSICAITLSAVSLYLA